MFSFPVSYGGTKDGFQVSVDLLREVAEVSEVLQGNQDFFGRTFKHKTARSYTTSRGTKAYRNHERIFVFKKKISLLVDNLCYYFLPD